MTLATIEYTDANQMLADYAARRRRLYELRPEPVAAPEPIVEQPEPEEIPDFLAVRKRDDWIDLTTPVALKPATTRIIISAVCRATRATHLDITSHRRTAAVVKARMIACWIMRNYTPLSLPQIGTKLGGRDHTTVLHSVRRVEEMRSESALYRSFVDEIVADVEREMRFSGGGGR